MTINEQDIIKRLRQAIEEAGSQRAFATQHGISPQYLNDVLNGHRSPGPKILDALGIKRVTEYREQEEE